MAISFGAAASFCFSVAHRGGESCAGSSPRMRRSNSARCRAASAARRCSQASRAGRPRARRRRAMRCRMSAGISNGGEVQPSFCAGAGDLLGAERRAVAFSVPPLVGAPKPMVVRQAIIDGRSDFRAASMRRRDRRRIVAVDARWRPSRRPRSASPDRRESESDGRAVDGDAVVVVQHDQLVRASDARRARSLPG